MKIGSFFSSELLGKKRHFFRRPSSQKIKLEANIDPEFLEGIKSSLAARETKPKHSQSTPCIISAIAWTSKKRSNPVPNHQFSTLKPNAARTRARPNLHRKNMPQPSRFRIILRLNQRNTCIVTLPLSIWPVFVRISVEKLVNKQMIWEIMGKDILNTSPWNVNLIYFLTLNIEYR